MKAKLLCFGAKRQKILGIFGGDHLEKTVTPLEKTVTPLEKTVTPLEKIVTPLRKKISDSQKESENSCP